MKKILLLLLMISNLTFSQTLEKSNSENYKENLNKTFIEYYDLVLSQDFEKSMDFILPKLFEIIPRNQLVLLMKQMYNTPGLEFKVDKPKIINYGKLKKFVDRYYSIISYSYDLKVKFNNVKKSDNQEQNLLNQNLIKLTLEKTYGSGNVNYNKKTKFYDINSVKNAFGISKNGITDWKFVIVEKKQDYILKKILPKELIEKL